jgi:site-specific recombinase XerD
MDTHPTFTSPLASVITRYLALKTALGRGYATERHLFRTFDAYLVAVGAADLTPAVFGRWCQTQAHLKSGIRRTQMRMVRNLCLYRRRTEPECFVPDLAFFPPCHQYAQPSLLTEDEMARLIATASTLFTTSAYPLRAQAIRVGLVLLYAARLRRGELVRLKERVCPLWPQTATLLRELCAERQLDLRAAVALFVNQRGQPLSRFGVGYLLDKYLQRAQATVPTLRGKRLHPHCVRHSTAVHLLKSGVDLSTIGQWLGHASLNTTNKYATIDLDLRRQALAQAHAPVTEMLAPWRHDATILEWLEAL